MLTLFGVYAGIIRYIHVRVEKRVVRLPEVCQTQYYLVTFGPAQSFSSPFLRSPGSRASAHRELARGLHELLSPGQSMGHASSLKALPLEVSQAELAATLEPLMESFLHAHEKHNAFTMLHLKVSVHADYMCLEFSNTAKHISKLHR